MKTIMAVLLLLVSTSLLAVGKPEGVPVIDCRGQSCREEMQVLPQAVQINPVSVPEPSILALIGLGIAGLAVARKRKI